MRPVLLSLFVLTSLPIHGDSGTPLFSQPWTPQARYASNESWSRCLGGNPGWIAMDDLSLGTMGFVTRVVWYGTVADPKQLAPTRRYTIGFWLDDRCRPSGLVCNCCITARAVRIGVDCAGRTVYRFESVGFDPVFFLPGVRVWMSVAEDDTTSARVGKPDFFWSGFKTADGCAALQFDGTRYRTVVDPCFRRPSGLAFELFGFVLG